MQAIELQTYIDPDGVVRLPGEYRRCFGQAARMIVLLPETAPAVAEPSADAGAFKAPQEEWRDPYELGKDLFDLGGPSSPPADPLKRQLWERLHEKYGAR